jgi:hypothetical protein
MMTRYPFSSRIVKPKIKEGGSRKGVDDEIDEFNKDSDHEVRSIKKDGTLCVME